MKKLLLILIATGVAGLLVSASAQPAPGDGNPNPLPPQPDQPGQPGVPLPDNGNGPGGGGPPQVPPEVAPQPDNGTPDQNPPNQIKETLVISPSQTKNVEPEQIQSDFMPPTAPGTNVNDINMNFNRAPLEMVLNYLSDAAGFIIVQDSRVTGTVTVNGKHLTRDEAYNLLSESLNKNGFAAIRDGRTLTIMDKNDAKTRQIPVKMGNNPDDIPKNAEIVTQIIPIRFVEARQLVSDLSSFVSPQATVVANEAGNSIVITDTQANIRHLAEIIKAVDDSAEAETEIQVFPLKYANPTDVASEIGSVFPSSSSGNTTQSPIRFGGGGPGGGGGFFARMMANQGGGGSGGGSSNDRIKKATQVSAVADLRVSSVIVTAPKDMMQEIGGMIAKLDVQSERDSDVYVYSLKNADPNQVAQVLQSMFQGNTSRSSSSSSQNSALQQRAQNSTTQMGSSSTGTGFGSSTGGGGGGRSGGTQF